MSELRLDVAHSALLVMDFQTPIVERRGGCRGLDTSDCHRLMSHSVETCRMLR